MTTVSSLTGTNTSPNMGVYTYTQPQNSVMSLFEQGFQSSGYGLQGTQTQQVSQQTIPSILNENPKNLASLILENHYMQAYQEYMLNEAINEQQQASQATAQTAQTGATTDSTQPQTTVPTYQDVYIATQLANTIASQYGGQSLMMDVNKGLPTDFLLQKTPQTGINYSA